MRAYLFILLSGILFWLFIVGFPAWLTIYQIVNQLDRLLVVLSGV